MLCALGGRAEEHSTEEDEKNKNSTLTDEDGSEYGGRGETDDDGDKGNNEMQQHGQDTGSDEYSDRGRKRVRQKDALIDILTRYNDAVNDQNSPQGSDTVTEISDE